MDKYDLKTFCFFQKRTMNRMYFFLFQTSVTTQKAKGRVVGNVY